MLAIAGSLARKKHRAGRPGTLPTHTPLFVVLLVGVVVLVGALTFVPALALGPIVEHLHADCVVSHDGDHDHVNRIQSSPAVRPADRAAGDRATRSASSTRGARSATR